MVVPLAKRSKVMSAGHKSLIGGYFSHNKMASHLKWFLHGRVWKGMLESFERHVQSARKLVDHYYRESL